MPSKPFIATIADLPREVIQDGAFERTATISDNGLFQFVWMRADFGADWPGGTEMPSMHRHAHDQMMVVFEGEMELVIGDEVSFVKGGDVCYVPANKPHAARPNGVDVFVMEAYSPIRTDFLYVAEHQLGHGAVAREPDGSRNENRPAPVAMRHFLGDSELLSKNQEHA